MTVAEYILALQQLPPETEVVEARKGSWEEPLLPEPQYLTEAHRVSRREYVGCVKGLPARDRYGSLRRRECEHCDKGVPLVQVVVL